MALFSEAEARAFRQGGETPLSNTTTYPAGDITAAAARIKDRFEQICRVSLEPSTSTTYTFDGTGTDTVLLPHVKPLAVTAATNADTALSASELTNLKVYNDGRVRRKYARWSRGYRNCSITYTHGWAAVPAPIKRAAIQMAIHDLCGSNIPMRATSQANELGTFRIATAGGERSWTGLPEVDAVLAEYRIERYI